MPVDSQWAIQTLIYDILKDDTNLQAVLAGGAAGVYDHVPDGAAFPYCVISDIEARPEDTSGFDAKSFTTLFQAGACFRHQPHPGDAIHLTNNVRPESTSS